MTKQLELIIGVASRRSGRRSTAAKAVTRIEPGIETALGEVGFEGGDKSGTGERRTIDFSKERCVWGLGINSEEEG